jgi:hypothetical protein
MVRSVTGADASCTRLIGSGMDYGSMVMLSGRMFT